MTYDLGNSKCYLSKVLESTFLKLKDSTLNYMVAVQIHPVHASHAKKK